MAARASTRKRQSAVAAVAVVLAAGVTSACGTRADDDVADRAADFYAAVADSDAATACADLAPKARQALEQQEGRSCEAAILEQQLPEVTDDGDVRVYGSMAQVVFANETVFLSRYDGEWLLTAVGCEPASGDEPHDCTIEVG